MAMQSSAFFLHDHRIGHDTVESILAQTQKALSIRPEPHIFKKRKKNFPPGSILFVMVPDDDFTAWLMHIAETETTIVILPYESNPLQQKNFIIPGKVEDALALAAAESSRIVKTYIRCNGEATIRCITIGESDWIEHPEITEVLKNLFSMRLRGIHIKTAKEQEIKTAALMIEAGLTLILLPSIAFPLSACIAAFALPTFEISTKPKPLDLPVVLSKIKVQDCTSP